MADVYLELQRNGSYLKCTATDSVSGEEAIAIGPLNDPEGVKRLAVLKLRNKLQPPKSSGGATSGGIKV